MELQPGTAVVLLPWGDEGIVRKAFQDGSYLVKVKQYVQVVAADQLRLLVATEEPWLLRA